ncbi:hypothetical protein XENOCAPTIV_009119, partial [Xenoophorus captivus]
QPSSMGVRPNQDGVLTSSPANSGTKGLENDKDGYVQQLRRCSDTGCSLHQINLLLFFSAFRLKSSLLLTSASKIEPMKALDSRFTERSKATPGIPSAISSTAGLTPLER